MRANPATAVINPSPLQQYQKAFVRHLREPDAAAPPAGVNPARIGVYVELLYTKIEDSLLACFPLTREWLGLPAWQQLVRGFIAQHRCATPFYRQIPDEFIDYARNACAEPDGYPPWVELAHYEWVDLRLFLAADEPEASACDPDGDLLAGVPVFAPVITLLWYRYPVHQLEPAHRRADGATTVEPAPVFILGYRDTDDDVRFLEISAATARLIALLQGGGGSGRMALTQLAEDLQHPDREALLAFGVETLRYLSEQGAILGTQLPSKTNTRSHP